MGHTYPKSPATAVAFRASIPATWGRSRRSCGSHRRGRFEYPPGRAGRLSSTYRFQEADSDLRGGTDDDLVYINFSRLLDGEHNSARDRRRWYRHLLHPLDNLGFDPAICHGIREVRLDKSRRNARHAQLIAGFLPQGLGDSAHRVLRAGIDRHGRYDLNSGCRNDVDEMSETLSAENRQGGGDAV